MKVIYTLLISLTLITSAHAESITCKDKDETQVLELKRTSKNHFRATLLLKPSAGSRSKKTLGISTAVIATREDRSSVIISPEYKGEAATWDETEWMFEVHAMSGTDPGGSLMFAPHSQMQKLAIEMRDGHDSGYLYCEDMALKDLAE